MIHIDNKMKAKNTETHTSSTVIMVFQAANLLEFLWKDKLYGELVICHSCLSPWVVMQGLGKTLAVNKENRKAPGISFS